MAVATKNSTKVSIVLVTGAKDGKETKKTMNISKIKTMASDDSVYATAKAIEPLLKYPVFSIERNDNYTLTDM